MADTTIKVGDIVSLKSHPKYQLTVEYIDGENATCAFFHPVSHDFQHHTIALRALIKID